MGSARKTLPTHVSRVFHFKAGPLFGVQLFAQMAKFFLRRLLESGMALAAIARKAGVLDQKDRDQPTLRIDRHVGCHGAAVNDRGCSRKIGNIETAWRPFARISPPHRLHRLESTTIEKHPKPVQSSRIRMPSPPC